MFLYACFLERGEEGGFLLFCVGEDVLVVCPGFIDGGEFGILGNAGSDGELIGGVSEESIGGDRRGSEVDVLHLCLRGRLDVSFSFIIRKDFSGMC